MCLALAAQVVELPDRATAVVVRNGRRSTVSLLAADSEVNVGDWVLVHSGFVLERLSETDVQGLIDIVTDGDRHEHA